MSNSRRKVASPDQRSDPCKEDVGDGVPLTPLKASKQEKQVNSKYTAKQKQLETTLEKDEVVAKLCDIEELHETEKLLAELGDQVSEIVINQTLKHHEDQQQINNATQVAVKPVFDGSIGEPKDDLAQTVNCRQNQSQIVQVKSSNEKLEAVPVIPGLLVPGKTRLR